MVTAVIALGVITASAIAFVLVSNRDQQPAPSVAAHPSPQAAGEQLRTLKLVTGKEPEPSRPGNVMHGLLTDGKAPREVAAATVLTDENCQPDAQGISHCTNRLRLADGKKLVVTHPHDMSEVPCMTPGEKVRVVAETRTS